MKLRMISRVGPPVRFSDAIVVGFSGHCHLNGRESVVREVIESQITSWSRRNPKLIGICSAAVGADTLFAESILARNLALQIILPFNLERFANLFSQEPPGTWERARDVIFRARRVDVVASSPREKVRKAHDDAAYLEATRRTVDRADILFAIWNGRPGMGIGGTADAVAYAQELGLPQIIYNPETATLREFQADYVNAPQVSKNSSK